MRRIRRIARNRFKVFLFSLLPTVFVITVGELLLHLAFPTFDYVVVMGKRKEVMKIWSDPSVWRRVEDERRIVLVPNPSNGVNTQGYRGHVIPEKKDPSVLRILCLGDSTTYGVGVRSNETYSSQLETILKEHNCKAEVINGGVPSYTSKQGLAALKWQWEDYRPDLIITYFGNNDVSRVMSRPDKDLDATPHTLPFVRALLARSRVYLCMQALYLHMMDESQWVSRVSADDYKENLIMIGDLAKSIEARIVHLRPVVPSDGGFWDGGYSIDVDFLFLRKAFIDSKRPQKKLFLDGVHPTQEGHRIIAEYLFETLQAGGFLDRCVK